MSNIYERARQEFLLDRAAYFIDKDNLYLTIKDSIAGNLSLPHSMIRVCGSAYWGKSFTTEKPFAPGTSDLDVAIISERYFVQLLSEVRSLTANFSNLTHFLKSDNPQLFQEYAYRKGIIRLDICPAVSTKLRMETFFKNLSRSHLNHFERISASIYDTEVSFTNKQARALEKFGTKND